MSLRALCVAVALSTASVATAGPTPEVRLSLYERPPITADNVDSWRLTSRRRFRTGAVVTGVGTTMVVASTVFIVFGFTFQGYGAGTVILIAGGAQGLFGGMTVAGIVGMVRAKHSMEAIEAWDAKQGLVRWTVTPTFRPGGGGLAMVGRF